MPVSRIKLTQIKNRISDAVKDIRGLPRGLLLEQAINKYKLAQIQWTAKGQPITPDELKADMASDWKVSGWVFQNAGITFDQLYEAAKAAIADPSGAVEPPPDVQKLADSSIIRKVAAPAILKIGRNKPCPCGSGLKYKKCCGR